MPRTVAGQEELGRGTPSIGVPVLALMLRTALSPRQHLCACRRCWARPCCGAQAPRWGRCHPTPLPTTPPRRGFATRRWRRCWGWAARRPTAGGAKVGLREEGAQGCGESTGLLPIAKCPLNSRPARGTQPDTCPPCMLPIFHIWNARAGRMGGLHLTLCQALPGAWLVAVGWMPGPSSTQLLARAPFRFAWGIAATRAYIGLSPALSYPAVSPPHP